MATLRLADVAAAVGGRVLGGAPGLAFRAFGIDSRRTVPGELFFAVAGRRDGHDFVAAAAARGAAGAVVSRPVAVPALGFGLVEVEDTVEALQDLARSVLAARPVRVVGITGSVGKTTTKDFTAELLSARFRVLRSEANFNNRLGLALSLLRLEPWHEAVVLEMGMSAAGEIRALAAIAPPDIAVITNIHPVHLQFFKGMEEIALAKKEILDGAKPGATAVLNGDSPLVMKIAAGWKGPRVTFGLGPECDVRALDIRSLGYAGQEFALACGPDRARVVFPFVSEAAVMNLLAAVAACRAAGLTLAELGPRIAALRPSPMRGVMVELPGGVSLYDDAYNSNPKALEAALKSLAVLPAARRVAVLGDMLELGEDEREFHRQAGAAVARFGWDVLVAVGPLAVHIAEEAATAGLPRENILTFADSRDAAEAVVRVVRDGDLVLVKGSRGMKMETIVERLIARRKE
ncbi:MAG TPA: UDP-N-acetylmuramoyl-tripeptide--D-alanyl-D-alanine ligase [Terriglobales bacterium]|nr:UDP-N-acetylmuramoyl-tripeptide--D-alanyl-D-alanine ligase [Terriglobales bacterium]